MQLCKNKGMYDACMQLWKYIVWKYIDLQLLKYQHCKYESMEIFMYKRIKIYKCAGLQIFKCVHMPLCMYASIQIYQKVTIKEKKYASKYMIMQPSECTTIYEYGNNQLLPYFGPIREFQLSLKSCNLASWSTNWHYFRPDCHPTQRMRNRPTHSPLGQKKLSEETKNLWGLAFRRANARLTLGGDTLRTDARTNIKGGDTLRTDARTNTHAGFLRLDLERILTVKE